ncbi:GNAT family N-acetyltransferase [Pedosphaera parvula]|uniref:BioF2-like acetyltransferase domain-containing protein n=1 Tax=Pedosphaera parvula (strain Ellin514) TaxID=320771 RepID=B9XD25_PEDPL|nr:GNAT family N-acetyltransferase [Pedosphaera parvula]EEF62371.1 conserved hypothetical protein [Pedosphaera parvula Ellin514]
MPEHPVMTIKVLRTFEEIEGARPIWSAFQRTPEADIDFVQFIIRMRSEILRPHVIIIYEDGKPISLVAARIEKGHLEVKAGYKVLWRHDVCRLAVFYDGFMGRTDPGVAEFAIGQMLNSLKEEKADLLVWDGIRWESELHELLKSKPNLLCRDYLARVNHHWTMSLPSSLDELLETKMSKKHRYWAKRTMRMLEKDFPGGVRYASFSTLEQMDKLFQDVLVVARKTYQWGLGVGFRETEEHRKRLELEAKKGWHRGYILYLKEEPVAFWICTVYGGTVYLDYTGYDPILRKYEVGTVLFLRVISELCGEGIKQLDFGAGTAFYKEKFGDAQFDETMVCVFASNLRGIWLSLVRLIAQGPMEVLRKTVRQLGVEQKLKKLWRSRSVSAQEPAKALPSEV